MKHYITYMLSVIGAGIAAAFSTDWSSVKFIRLTLALDNAASAIGSVSDVLNS